MNSNLYLTILKELSKKGLMEKQDISNVLFFHFKNEDIYDHNFNLKEQKIVDFLQSMKQAGHIDYKIEHYRLPKSPADEIRTLCNLTVAGFTFYKDHERNKLSILLSWVAVGISIIAVVFTGISTFKSM